MAASWSSCAGRWPRTRASARSCGAAASTRVRGAGAQRARRGDGARAGALVLLPLHRAATRSARSAAPAPRPPRPSVRSGCASRSAPASTSSTATTPPIAICSPRTSTWWCSSATTSTRAAGAPAVRGATHGGEARTLDEYRTRHAQYKTDPDLQRLHAAVPVARDVGRPRGRQRLRRRLRSESLDPRLPAPPRRRLPGVLRAHAAARARPPHGVSHGPALAPRLGAAGALPRARRPPAPHAAGLPAAGPRRRRTGSTSAAASCTRPAAPCSAPRRSAGSPTACAPRPSAGTSSPSRR